MGCDISVRFHAPPDDLKAFFTTFYRTELTCNDGPVSDSLQPEWAGVRILRGERPVSSIAGKDGRTSTIADADITVAGPTSLPISFRVGDTALWGLGLLPLGWATFMPVPAHSWANRIGDGRTEADFAAFVPLADMLDCRAEQEEADLARLITFFRETIARNNVNAQRIIRIHKMLLDTELPNVMQMAQACKISQRTLERVCASAFGFSPKLLLRRQRFMRSLASFMLDPTLSWIGAIDSLYFDQSHFVRDCYKFLGMAPSAFAQRDHPIMAAFMRERMKAHGAAVQTLDKPV